MKRVIQIVIAIVATVTVISLAAIAVFAHADYESSIPARDEVVPEAPERVDVWFTQDLVKREGLYFVRVFDEAETQVSGGDGVVDDDDRSHVFAELPPGLGTGRYIVRWMTTSDIDGDDDEGAFCFYVGVEPAADQEAECAEFADELPPTPTRVDDQPADPTPTVTAPVDGSDDDGSNAGLIIGIIVAVVAAVAVVGGGLVWLSRRE